MKKIINSFFSILIPLLCYSQEVKVKKLDSLFMSLHSKNSFNGTVLIAEKGKVLFEQSYGYADELTKRKINNSTIFELASVSKQFTAMGIVLLHKKGKLEYDDQLSKYIPELANYKGITIRNLLNHTGGLPDYMTLFEKKWDKSKFATNESIVIEFVKHQPPLLFAPNEKFEYSNTGYALLALIIERVSKQSFEDFLKQSIFKPLQMTKTFVYRSRFKPQFVDNYAFGYVMDSIGNKVLTDSFGKDFYTYYLDGIVGDGMVNSTARDLLLWDRALYGNQLIDDQDRAEIYKPSATTDGKKNEYGFGWITTQNEKYGTITSHSGGWAGYSTFFERHLSNDKTIILLQNNSLPSTKIPIKEIRNILYNEPLKIEKKIYLKTEDLDHYLGTYASENFPLKIMLSKKDNILFAQATGQGEIPLESYENNTFMFSPADIKMVFNVKEQTFELFQGGMRIVFKKQ